jgi:hypothetical protein
VKPAKLTGYFYYDEMTEKYTTHEIGGKWITSLVGKSEGNRSLGRCRHRGEDYIEVNPEETV